MRRFIIVFILLNLLLSVYYIDIWRNDNVMSRSWPIVSFYKNGNLQIDEFQEKLGDKSFIQGHYYSDKAPLPMLAAIPFYGLLKCCGIITSNDQISGSIAAGVGGVICGSVPFVLIVLIVFFAVNKVKSSISPVLLAMLPLYGSFIFTYSGMFFGHLLTALFVLLSYISLTKQRYFVAGIFIGLAFMAEYTTFMLMGLWALVILVNTKKVKPLISYLFGCMPAIIFMLVYNYVFSGNPFTFLYKYENIEYVGIHQDYGFRLLQWDAIWGLSFSLYRGIFIYCPFLITFFIIAFKYLPEIKQNLNKVLRSYFILPVIIYFFVVASYYMWWGGWAYGPRHLLVIAVLGVYVGTRYVSENSINKIVFFLLTIAGLVFAFLDKISLVCALPTEVKQPFMYIFKNIQDGNYNPNNLLTLIFNAPPIVSALIWALLFVFSVVFLTKWYKKIALGV